MSVVMVEPANQRQRIDSTEQLLQESSSPVSDDGDDTASAMPFRDALEYARRSGVTVYTIGLDVGKLQTGVRGKLNDLAKETGGRSFFISRASELVTVYNLMGDPGMLLH